MASLVLSPLGGEGTPAHDRRPLDGDLLGREGAVLEDGKPTNIVLLGPPAGGKGTQADFLSERYGMVHISTGDLLRARAKFLPELAEYMNSGKLVPDELVSSMLRERLQERDCARGVLLDGFPRTRAQAESLRAAGVPVDAVLHLKVADEVVIDRIGGRRIDPITGKTYHTTDNPPPPDVLPRVIQREDDTVDKIIARLKIYHAEVDAITSFYGARVRTVRVGGGPGSLPPDVMPMVVFDEVRKVLEGDTYWGSVVRSELMAKCYECGTHSLSLLSVASYFQHSRFRLLNNGCLADTTKAAKEVVLRAQVVWLFERIRPLEKYELCAWIEDVSKRTVVLGHAMTRRDSKNREVDVAVGTATVVFVGDLGEAMDIENRGRLLELSAKAGRKDEALKKRPSFLDDGVEDSRIDFGHIPISVWEIPYCVPAADLDYAGRYHENAGLNLWERLRFQAAASGAFPQAIQKQALQGTVLSSRLACREKIVQGEVLLASCWPLDSGEGDDLELAFELRRPREGGRHDLVMRGQVTIAAQPEPTTIAVSTLGSAPRSRL